MNGIWWKEEEKNKKKEEMKWESKRMVESLLDSNVNERKVKWLRKNINEILMRL